jgi:hypothetical protein
LQGLLRPLFLINSNYFTSAFIYPVKGCGKVGDNDFEHRVVC